MTEYRVGVEIGGTFTDLVLLDERGRIVRRAKVLSTPRAPQEAVFHALDEIAGTPEGRAAVMVHGSTIATNAVLERKGAVTALLVTAGFRDVLEIARQEQTDLYDLKYQSPRPVVERSRIVEITERLAPDGSVVIALDETAALAACAKLFEADRVQSIAICFLHSFQNEVHERRMAELLRNELHWEGAISLSCEVLPEFREYERASTVAMNAYVKPIMDGYLGEIERNIAQRGIRELHIMQSNGGVLPAAQARSHAVRTLLSGPAAGATGAAYDAVRLGLRHAITLDMGGTSTDVCRIADGRIQVTTDYRIDGLPLRVPMADIATVGAGGGSLASVDSGGMLRVGPQSAGGDPGPVSYGRGGTQPTVTDANVVLGLIRPDLFLGGRMPLDVDAARRAIGALADTLGLSSDVTSEGVIRVANTSVGHAIRAVSTARGFDPRDHVLFAYGGAGPLHAALVAEKLGIDRVMVPPDPGLFSAFGLLVADFTRDYVKSEMCDASALASSTVLERFETLETSARADLAAQISEAHGKCTIRYQLDLRYVGQGFELPVDVELEMLREGGNAYIERSFHAEHKARYGHAFGTAAIELVSFRLTLAVPQVIPERAPWQAAKREEPIQRPIYLQGAQRSCAFVRRDALAAGVALDGPAVIGEDTATILVPAGWRVTVHELGHLILERR